MVVLFRLTVVSCEGIVPVLQLVISTRYSDSHMTPGYITRKLRVALSHPASSQYPRPDARWLIA
jgi:hypothetical protein